MDPTPATWAPMQGRRSFMIVVSDVLSEEFDIIHRFETNFWRTFMNEAGFASAVWMFYSLTICGIDPHICDDTHWVIEMPIIAMAYGKSSRETFFEYLWNYMAALHLYQALIYGTVWTWRNTMLITRIDFELRTDTLQKMKLYLSNLVDIGIGLVVQPLLTFYVAREVTTFLPHFGPGGAESRFWAGTILHALRIVSEIWEELEYDRGSAKIRLMMAFLLGVYACCLADKTT